VLIDAFSCAGAAVLAGVRTTPEVGKEPGMLNGGEGPLPLAPLTPGTGAPRRFPDPVKALMKLGGGT
jgi:hypothetical protein